VRDLLVTADLTLECTSGTVRLVGRGRELVAEAPTFRAARALAGLRAVLPAGGAPLAVTGLRLVARVRRRRVATVDPAVPPGRIARRFGVTRLHPAGVAAAALAALGPRLRRAFGG